MKITDFIPKGTNSTPISREDLVSLTGLSDRAVRREIANARLDYPIVNVNGGYYIADSPKDPKLEHFVRRELHRQREVIRGLQACRVLLQTDENQERLF